MAKGVIARIPIWVRVPGLIALVLVVVLISPMLLDAAGVGVNRGSDETEMEGSDHGSGGSDETEGTDHSGD